MMTLLCAATISLSSVGGVWQTRNLAYNPYTYDASAAYAESAYLEPYGGSWGIYQKVLWSTNRASEVDTVLFYETAQEYGLHVGPKNGGDLNAYSASARSWANNKHWGYGLRHRP